jgi:hypothetical protein
VTVEALSTETIEENEDSHWQENRSKTADSGGWCRSDGGQVKECLENTWEKAEVGSERVHTGSQQHELWRSAENTGAKASIQAVGPESFWADVDDEWPFLDDVGVSQHDAMALAVDSLWWWFEKTNDSFLMVFGRRAH